jgi:hypothetical protein
MRYKYLSGDATRRGIKIAIGGDLNTGEVIAIKIKGHAMRYYDISYIYTLRFDCYIFQ